MLEKGGKEKQWRMQGRSQDFSKGGGGGRSHCVKVQVLTRLSLTDFIP